MIQQIHVFNYLCIYDMTIDLSWSGTKAPAHYEDYEGLLFVQQGNDKKKVRNNRIVPVLSLYGANSSGKTTVLKAVNELKNIVSEGVNFDNFQPNRIKQNSKDKQYTEFEIVFWKEGDKYDYLLRYDNERILKEELKKNDDEIFLVDNNRICKVFDAITEIGDLEKEYRTRCINISNNCQIKTFLSGIAKAYPGTSRSINMANEYILNDILVLHNNKIPFLEGVNKLSSVYGNELSEEEREYKAVREIVKYLGKLDLGIVDIEVLKEQRPLRELRDVLTSNIVISIDKIEGDVFRANSIYTVHKSEDGKDVKIKLYNESKGTRLLMGLLGFLLYSIKKGKTILVDELDESMHSLLLIQLVRLFKEKRLNKNSQLIFTAHNTDLLASDLLSEYEIGFIKYEKKSGTTFSSLADNHDIRYRDNRRQLYLDGYFGGVPFPYV